MAENKLLYFIDDDTVACHLFERACEKLSHNCCVFSSADECIQGLGTRAPDVVLTDLNMPGMNGFELIETMAEKWPAIPVIALTGQSSVERAVRAMRAGACDFLQKPYEMSELTEVINRNLKYADLSDGRRSCPRQPHDKAVYHGMIGQSAEMIRTFKMIDKLSGVDCSVVISGQSGSGKELAAKAIHYGGMRKEEPFVAIDCGSLPDTLLESELFGHVKGAFTGASSNRKGLFEAAGSGTIFLDEIGNISSAMQAKLLRVCQENIVTPVGGNREIKINARFIVASNRDLAEMVEKGEFRHDLYHRLNVISLPMPELSKRREDVPLLTTAFVDEFTQRHKRPQRSFSPAMIEQISRHAWPGNIRELRNFIERCVILAEGETLDDIAQEQLSSGSDESLDKPHASLSELEAEHIQKVLDSVNGNQLQAAKILGISRTTLWRKLNDS